MQCSLLETSQTLPCLFPSLPYKASLRHVFSVLMKLPVVMSFCTYHTKPLTVMFFCTHYMKLAIVISFCAYHTKPATVMSFCTYYMKLAIVMSLSCLLQSQPSPCICVRVSSCLVVTIQSQPSPSFMSLSVLTVQSQLSMSFCAYLMRPILSVPATVPASTVQVGGDPQIILPIPTTETPLSKPTLTTSCDRDP